MSDDWKPGDLALCVKRGGWRKVSGGGAAIAGQIEFGRVYRVARVKVDDDIWLAFGPVGTGLFRHSRFIKLSGHTPDAEDEETIRLLTGKPVREPAA